MRISGVRTMTAAAIVAVAVVTLQMSVQRRSPVGPREALQGLTGAAAQGLHHGQLHRTHEGEPDAQADRDHHDAAPGKYAYVRRLESFTWNSVEHKLTWVISEGQRDGDAYKSNQAMNYGINMDDATMTFQAETRRFSKEEAANVHVLMNLVSKYAVDSTVWWDEGNGEPVHGRHRPSSDKQRVPVLHVSGPPAPRPQALDQEIRELQQRLTKLKLLRITLSKNDPLRPASY